MDVSSNICLSCCKLHPTSNLTQLTAKQAQFLHSFLVQDVTRLVICNSCNTRLEEFKQFLDNCKRNINMIKTVSSEHETCKKSEEPDSTWTRKSERKYSTTITNEHENKDERHLNEEEKKEYKVIKFQDSIQKKITTQPTQEALTEHGLVPVEVTPDVSIVMDTGDISENSIDNDVLEAVSPPPSNDLVSTCSILNPAGVPLLLPIVSNYGEQDPLSSPSAFHIDRLLSSDARRKQRNREASRRYRERARGDPELLQKMREQQNIRQKKYYERLKMKRQNSQDWTTVQEEGGERVWL